MKKNGWPKWVTDYTDRHGKLRTRFRRKGQKTYTFKNRPRSKEWWNEYEACKAGGLGTAIQPGKGKAEPGTIEAVCLGYMQSHDYYKLASSTKTDRRRILDKFSAQYGHNPIGHLSPADINGFRDELKATPFAFNNLFKAIRAICRYAMDHQIIDRDPTVSIRRNVVPSEGIHTWTDAELAQFEATYPIGTRERLAYCLLLDLAQRKSDVVRMQWNHIQDGHIAIKQKKTGSKLILPLTQDLLQAFSMTPRDNMTILVTDRGVPFTPASFGNWFRKVCDKAGLNHCTSHGLRKATSRRLAEINNSASSIKSVTGHKTLSEVERYTRETDQKRMAERAVASLEEVRRRQRNG